MSDKSNCNSGSTSAPSALLGCPWCGVLPEYQPRAQGHTDADGHTYWWPHQIVHNCKVLGQQICVRAHTAGLPESKESVFSVWNTRAARKPNAPHE